LNESPVPPSQRAANPVTPELEEPILRCLEKEPNLRPQSVGELRALMLTSARASEWGPDSRAAWWKRYESLANPSPIEPDLGGSDPFNSTVKIDFASRIK
jgi:hypothetical protein